MLFALWQACSRRWQRHVELQLPGLPDGLEALRPLPQVERSECATLPRFHLHLHLARQKEDRPNLAQQPNLAEHPKKSLHQQVQPME